VEEARKNHISLMLSEARQRVCEHIFRKTERIGNPQMQTVCPRRRQNYDQNLQRKRGKLGHDERSDA